MIKCVCLDPGHGPGTVNGSPDGTYKEREFTWDLYTRVKPLLEAAGLKVVVTRTENDKPSLTARAQVSNRAGADLLVSLHSNAAGNGGWYDARGFMIYTSAGPDSAPRNQAAKSIIEAAKAAGVLVRGSGLAHNPYTVLTAATAPAVLIEYGFHTSREDVALLKDSAYRDKLAKATVSGILDYFGMDYPEEDVEEGEPDKPDTWASEAWGKAAAAGVLDGTRPRDTMTRQELALVLDRLGLLEEVKT